MKKFLFLSLALLFGLSAVAQKGAQIPDNLKNLPAKRLLQAVDNSLNLSNFQNPYVSASPNKATIVNDVQIGSTQYDLQTNQSVQNRIFLFPDATIGATWTMGTTPSTFPERGTGYNYYDGVAWGTSPTARIEGTRCGWPSHMPLGNGECVITHDGASGLLITSRATKGTGTWTTTNLTGPPTTNGGTTALLWPRAIATSGDTIHLIACTDQAASGTTIANMKYYQGLALALVYYRSPDGGLTWEGPTILPGMDSASIRKPYNCLGFSGDSYSWAAPRHDTIAFVVGESWGDLFVMKSFDGGTNWTKILIYDFPEFTVAPTPIVATIDGGAACALDANGEVHVVVGKLRVSDDDFSDDPPATSYYPYTDGLLYWEEGMLAWDSATLNNDNLLYTNGQLITSMLDYSGNDTIDFPVVGTGEFPFGSFYNCLSGFPQIIIDQNDDMFVTYSSCREDKVNSSANPNVQLYRDLYLIESFDLGSTWQDTVDLVDNTLHLFEECIFGSLSYTSNSTLHIVYQADTEPGLAVRGDLDPYAENYIYYLNVTKVDGTDEINGTSSNEVSIYPNPANSYTNVAVNLTTSQNVSIDVYNMLGQSVYSKNYGTLSAGQHNLFMNTNRFDRGIYFFGIQTGAEKVTRKVIVE